MNEIVEFREQRLNIVKEDLIKLSNSKLLTTAIIHSIVSNYERVGVGHLLSDNDTIKLNNTSINQAGLVRLSFSGS